MLQPPFRRRLLAAAVLAAGLPPAALAQSTQTIVITGQPLVAGSAQPASVLRGDALVRRRAATLGDTLDGLPGVAATGFGPGASRPVIRGLDGERVRLLEDGGAALDASALSFDHAAAGDPLIADRIEVLRGPAVLLYGGNAIGGLVNTIQNRIPQRAPASAFGGRAELRGGGAAPGPSGAVVLEGAAGPGLAWHVDAFGRDQDALRVPRHTPVDAGEALPPADRVRNSASRSSGGAVGFGVVGSGGQHLGAAVDTVRRHYGVVVEPDVAIDMQRDRLDVQGRWRPAGGGWLRDVEARATHARYRHDEIEGDGAIATRFASRGTELRVLARHAAWAGWQGAFGAQLDRQRFSAQGDEAFVPATRTRSTALFGLQERRFGDADAGWQVAAGARIERVQVDSLGDAPDAAEPRFGAAVERRFSPKSVQLALSRAPERGWTLHAAVGSSQRAPAYHELYADGVHVATAAVERGDPTLGVERSRHVELGIGWRGEGWSVQLDAHAMRFGRYLALDATGVDVTLPGEDGEPDRVLPEYAWRGVRARLAGFEIEAQRRWTMAGLTFELSGSVDAVRGTQSASGEALPRLPPRRARLALVAGSGAWQVGAGLRHAAAQRRVPATDRATPGWTMLDLWAGASARPDALGWFVQLANATDELAYNASSIAGVRDLAPLGGRALSAGIRAVF
jgi:iron complex outermembrane receptor protein